MSKSKTTAQGFVLLDLDNVALNNLGKDETTTYENAVAVKKIYKEGRAYPFISGQAWRYWWRETLALDFGWELSPVTRDKRVAFTAANPIIFPDDDLFGYMRAAKEDGKDVTLTRVSPLKNSVLMAVAPATPINEWSVMARQQEDPVPYEKQVYACVMKGMFSIDLDEAGTFYTQTRSGFCNLNAKLIQQAREAGAVVVEDPLAKDRDGKALDRYRLPRDIRLRRVSDTLRALKTIAGGAKRTTNLADVTPKLVVLAVLRGGNHPFSHLATANGNEAEFSVDRLAGVVKDYETQFLSKIYVGRRSGFMDHLSEPLQQLVAREPSRYAVGSVVEMIDTFVNNELPASLPD